MMLKNIDQKIYENEVAKTKSGLPALLCFFKNKITDTETFLSIEELSRHFESIQFYAAQEEDHEFFFGKFHFLGTPIFIFVVNGIERARLFGKVSNEGLRAFIANNINKLNPP